MRIDDDNYPPMTDDTIVVAINLYFLQCGCYCKVVRHLSSVMVELPCSRTEWRVTQNGDFLGLRIHNENMGRKKQKRTDGEFALADPECFPKMISHMQQHSEFLRSGNNQPTPQVYVV